MTASTPVFTAVQWEHDRGFTGLVGITDLHVLPPAGEGGWTLCGASVPSHARRMQIKDPGAWCESKWDPGNAATGHHCTRCSRLMKARIETRGARRV